MVLRTYSKESAAATVGRLLASCPLQQGRRASVGLSSVRAGTAQRLNSPSSARLIVSAATMSRAPRRAGAHRPGRRRPALSAEIRRVRVCGAGCCALPFLDHSPAHIRRWCSMSCRGKRTKVALPGASRAKQPRRVTGVPQLQLAGHPATPTHCGADEAQSSPPLTAAANRPTATCRCSPLTASMPEPRELSTEEVAATVCDFRRAAGRHRGRRRRRRDPRTHRRPAAPATNTA